MTRENPEQPGYTYHPVIRVIFEVESSMSMARTDLTARK